MEKVIMMDHLQFGCSNLINPQFKRKGQITEKCMGNEIISFTTSSKHKKNDHKCSKM